MDGAWIHSLLSLDVSGLLVPTVSVVEKVLRTILVYVFLVVALRLAGKRELAQLNPFDFIVLLVLSNTLQNAVIGNDNSVLGGFVGAATLLLVNAGVNRWVARHPKLEGLLEGRKRLLMVDGKVIEGALKQENLTLQELELAAHKQGLGRLDEAESAEIDPDGELYFVAKTVAPEVLHRELVDKLEALSQEVTRLRDELSLRR